MVKAKIRGKHRDGATIVPGDVPLDPHRHFVFPNRMREQRQSRGYPKLLRLASIVPDIPYIRLSKIERGEVVPRPDELRRIAAALNIAAAELLLDIDSPGFDIAAWAQPFSEGAQPDQAEERFAVLLAAAVRARRARDPALTIATIERDYGLPPVNLSRIEHAMKPFGRWNVAVQHALFALFGAEDEAELRATIEAQHRSGALDALLHGIANPHSRHERTRAHIAEVAGALETQAAAPPAPTGAAMPADAAPAPRRISVLGAPLAGGLIADTPSGEEIEAPRGAGARAFALRVCRTTLGGGLPAQATVIVDPDRYPAPGGIAALREAGGWRLLSVGVGRDGRMLGYSVVPELEIALDDHDPAQIAAVIGAIFP